MPYHYILISRRRELILELPRAFYIYDGLFIALWHCKCIQGGCAARPDYKIFTELAPMNYYNPSIKEINMS